jgi:hypothetical protein
MSSGSCEGLSSPGEVSHQSNEVNCEVVSSVHSVNRHVSLAATSYRVAVRSARFIGRFSSLPAPLDCDFSADARSTLQSILGSRQTQSSTSSLRYARSRRHEASDAPHASAPMICAHSRDEGTGEAKNPLVVWHFRRHVSFGVSFDHSNWTLLHRPKHLALPSLLAARESGVSAG